MVDWKNLRIPSRRTRIAAVTSLSDPARLQLYELVSRSSEAVSRDTAAHAVGLSRSTTAFHLDRLAAEGLLEVEYRRLSGKTGPGSGRPAKLYRRAAGELSVSIPERHYDFAGHLLASAIERSIDTGEPVKDVLGVIADDAGRALGDGAESLRETLEDNGFEPTADGSDVVLGNCPFAALAREHTGLVCDVNFHLVRGMEQAAPDSHTVISEPGAGRCCVRITAPDKAASGD
ncbi:MAG TPA: transcriptional regulator [Glaciibacter sp.]|nr:transcriptional regulator [Glaciibacter sp.]